MSVSCKEQFKRHYEAHLKHLRLKGLQPKTIEAYARAVRTVGAYFYGCIDDLSEQQLLDYGLVHYPGHRPQAATGIR